ncbi:MAG: hypothetical protein GEV13_33715 [Rhodospirillales bacterium]|nr:hypothetical protein [Rhodospirillales bacterium]
MNDNEATIPQRIAHLDAMASAARLVAKPGDERLAKQAVALEGLLKGVLTKVERLRRKGKQA